jgi:hypothetical protein
MAFIVDWCATWGFKPRFEDVERQVWVKIEGYDFQKLKMHTNLGSSISGLKYNQL